MAHRGTPTSPLETIAAGPKVRSASGLWSASSRPSRGPLILRQLPGEPDIVVPFSMRQQISSKRYHGRGSMSKMPKRCRNLHQLRRERLPIGSRDCSL